MLSSDRSELGGLGTVTIGAVSFNRLMALPDALVARKAVSVIIIKRGVANRCLYVNEVKG